MSSPIDRWDAEYHITREASDPAAARRVVESIRDELKTYGTMSLSELQAMIFNRIDELKDPQLRSVLKRSVELWQNEEASRSATAKAM